MAFIFSIVGLTVYIRYNKRKVRFKETTAFLREKANESLNGYRFLLLLWWLAWFFAVTGLVIFILFFVLDIVDLEQL